MSEYCEAVERGARLLDNWNPEWSRQVDVSVLDLSSPAHCVLGELFEARRNQWGGIERSGFEVGIFELRIEDSAPDFGFDLDEAYHDFSEGAAERMADAWAELKACWLAAIEERTDA